MGGWRGDFFMRERELRCIVRYHMTRLAFVCFFAASGVKTVFSTSSYVEKIVTMKKTKNNRFFVLKRAVHIFVHCTCSVQKCAQI